MIKDDLRRHSWYVRLGPAAVLSLTVPLLAVASMVTPDAAGLGTHQRLGLPPCGFLLVSGLPCATCGYTTAMSYAAHGQLWRAFWVQPAGATLAVVAAAMTIVSGHHLVMGVSLRPLGKRLWRPWLLWSMAGLVLGAWVYKILLVQGMFG